MSHECILKAEGLEKSYSGRKVVHNLDLNVNKGDVYGFLGPNGAGKTTTIKMILGLVRYNSGSVTILGHDIRKEFKQAIRAVGAVVETPRFYEGYSAYENLSMMKNLYGSIDHMKIDEVLNMVGLSKRSSDKVETYSLGMKQRLGIARALINDPELIVLDEPTNGLDPQGMKEIRDMIKLLAKERNITFFISTHLLNEVEVTCNKVGIISNGEKVAEGYVSELLNQDWETLEIHVDDVERASGAVGDFQKMRNLQVGSGFLRVEVERGASSDLARFLMVRDIELKYLIPKSKSLEEYFIEKTKGGEQID